MDYHLSQRGKDSGDGSRLSPWRTLTRLKRARVRPGDRVLLEGGGTFDGPLLLEKRHSGRPGKPVVVGSYGRGLATIRASKSDAVVCRGVSDLRLENLKLRGPGYKKMLKLNGLVLLGGSRVGLRGLDVREFPLNGVFVGGGRQILIEGCRAQNNGSCGIHTYDSHSRIRGLVIRHCVVENNPGTRLIPDSHSGSGIIVAGATGALVEYCRANRNGWAMPRKGNGPVGIWAWKADKVVIQHCLSYGNRSPGYDGGGFDFDGGVTNSVMQYNLSYGNIGCGYGMYQFPKAPRWKNNTVRFNISYMDGKNREGAGLHFWTGDGKRQSMSGCRFIHNTVVAGVGTRASAIRFEEYQVPFPGLLIRDNLFLFRGLAVHGQANLAKYRQNIYWNLDRKGFALGDHQSFEAWVRNTGQETLGGKVVGSFQDPRLVLPRSLNELPKNVGQMPSMKAFRLKAGSPARRKVGNIGAWQG